MQQLFAYAELVGATAPASEDKGRVTVRHGEPADAPALHWLFTEPEIVYWTLELPLAPVAAAYRHTTDLAAGCYMLVACLDGVVVGSLGFRVYGDPRARHVARLGPIAVSARCQGRGIGSALMAAAVDLADNWLNVQRLELGVYSDNAPAIALYRKYGFVAEGTHRAQAYRAGAYADVTTMARLRGDAARER